MVWQIPVLSLSGKMNIQISFSLVPCNPDNTIIETYS